MVFKNAKDKDLRLDWPPELASDHRDYARWFQQESNCCLDFHGDPATAQLVVFSDGNHHMALLDSLQLFSQQHGHLPIFYATTPPGPILDLLRQGALCLGNLVISAKPQVFICPPEILDTLVAAGFMAGHEPFVRNQGNVLLVSRGNPKGIRTVDDLAREDVRLFISNPQTEKASYKAYAATLEALASSKGLLQEKQDQGALLFGQRIHHRETPQAIFQGAADVAMVFYHLALRYVRLFPEHFELVPLGGSETRPQPLQGNVTGATHMGLVGDGGQWGSRLLAFLRSHPVQTIYRRHGLLPHATQSG